MLNIPILVMLTNELVRQNSNCPPIMTKFSLDILMFKGKDREDHETM